jgi:spermidine synthase
MARESRTAALPRGQRRVAPRVTISETDGVRYLHFGTEWVQGAMRIARPFKLELEYQQQMMASLLFVPDARRVCVLGLGAAALPKACWRALPRAHIEVVEVSEAVVRAARQWFKLPDSDRLEVTLADAAEFVAHPRRRGSVDWLQVDLYDAQARGPVCDAPEFYRDCRTLLARDGVAAFNLFGSRFEPSRERIDAAFSDRTFVLSSAFGNCVVLAFAGPLPASVQRFHEHVAALAPELRAQARRWLFELKSAQK